MPGLLSRDHVPRGISAELAEEFAGIFAAETVERYVFESYAALARSAKVTAHLSSLTARFAAHRLQAIAKAKGLLPARCRRCCWYVCRTPVVPRWRPDF